MTQMSPFAAKDMLGYAQQLRTLEEGIQKFFRYDSKFWKAFVKYLCGCEVGHCPFCELDYPLKHNRASYGVHWKRIYANPPGAGEDAPNVIRVCFEVDMWDEEWERERGASGMVDVPIKLITHFKQHEFDRWITEREEAHRVRRLSNAKEDLADLDRKYPELGLKKKCPDLLGDSES